MPTHWQPATLILISSILATGSPAQAQPMEPSQPDLRTAVERGLRRIEQGAANYPKNRQCFSCHHQSAAIHAFVAARGQRLAVDDVKLRQQVDFTAASFKPKIEAMRKGQGIGGASTTVAYALVALKDADYPADEITAAMIQFLLTRQQEDGSWTASTNRPPTEGSTFTTTAQAVRSLKAYGLAKATETAPEDQRDAVEKAIARGREWLTSHQPVSTEDRVFHLLGLLAAETAKESVDAARAELVKEQQADGGWSQLPDRPSDAYATGSVLTALHRAGLGVRDPVYQKGIAYLLRTQREDGAWLVETRSRPIQTFFDNGDPGGKSQFITFAATGWAVLALIPAIDPNRE